jgi:hypothetical protein
MHPRYLRFQSKCMVECNRVLVWLVQIPYKVVNLKQYQPDLLELYLLIC